MSQSYTYPAVTVAIPSGGATSANQVSEITQLTAINGKVLTDTQLRATPVPVSGAVTTDGLTDTQLRASAIPVSLTSTTITGSVAVTGPLTDAQLRASVVPVTLTSTTITGSVAVTGPLTDTQLRASAVPVTLTSTTITGSVAVTGPLTDAQLRATAVPISTLASSSSITSVASSASSVSILAINTSRKGATFFNDSTQICYLKLGTTASTSSYTVQLTAGAYYELPPGYIYTGAIDAIWASANGNLRITELS